MSGWAKSALAAALLNCGPWAAWAADASHGAWLKDGACALFSADAGPGDTVSWTGSCEGGYAQGLGTATFTHQGQAQSFTAIFVHGAVPDGHVISRWGQGWSYDGETIGGRFHGLGILTTETGDRFDGHWQDGRMNGFGVLLGANGERYIGDWKDDKPNGRGELHRADGSVQIGIFREGRLAQAAPPAPATIASVTQNLSYRIGDYQPGLETVMVKNSRIHLIDAATTEAQRAAPARSADASRCLKVDSDGNNWGFRNNCDFAIQFAYCMADGGDSLAACGGKDIAPTSIRGSVAALGFGALMADTSLKDKDAAHNFRWIACSGGSGEVIAYLDTVQPPAGRCERTRTASAN